MQSNMVKMNNNSINFLAFFDSRVIHTSDKQRRESKRGREKWRGRERGEGEREGK